MITTVKPTNYITKGIKTQLVPASRHSLRLHSASSRSNIASRYRIEAVKASNRQQGRQKQQEKSSILDAVPNSIKSLTLNTYIQIAIVLFELMVIDAAYSGDWSRLSIINSDQELWLQGFVQIGAVAHFFCGVAAGVISKGRGENSWISRASKATLVGTLTVFEVLFYTEDELASE